MQNSDLKVYKAKANGRMGGGSTYLVSTGVQQNVFPHVTSAQRTAGHQDAFKTFWKVADDADGTLIAPEIYDDAPTLSLTDYVIAFEMDQRETIASITGLLTTPPTDGRQKYGTAVLKNDITAGDSTFTVTVKAAALASGNDAIFAAALNCVITDKLTADALTGNEEPFVLTGTPSVSGLDVTLTRVGTFLYSYTADGVSRVSSGFKPGDTGASCETPVKTSTSGTINNSTYPWVMDWIGSVDEDWTFTLTDATHFTCVGDTLGTVGSGTVSTEFAPNNPDFTKPYFTIPVGFFSLTGWLAGDTVTATTHPAAIPKGKKRVIPALSASLANNKVTDVIVGEAV
jgi:hypothetical protein